MSAFHRIWSWRLSLALAFVGSMAVFALASQLRTEQPNLATLQTPLDEPAVANASLPENVKSVLRVPGHEGGSLTLQGYHAPAWAVPVRSLAATRERPIFSPARHATVTELSPPPPERPIPKEIDRPRLALLGAIAGEKDGIAIFMDEGTKDVFRMRTGETHLGWTLQNVAKREATLQNGREVAILAIPVPAPK